MRLSKALAGLLLGAFNSVAASSSLFESLQAIPEGWIKLHHADTSRLIHLRVALKQSNHDLFEQALLAVSTPEDPRYGQHLKRDDIKTLLKPTKEAASTIFDWLQVYGAKKIHDDGDWFHFYITVGEAERMLSTEFNVYRNSISKAERIRTLQYSLPKDIAQFVTMIQPTTRFGTLRAQRSIIFDVSSAAAVGPDVVGLAIPSLKLDANACNTSITTDCLRALYKIGKYQAKPSHCSLFGVAGYLNEHAKYSDLDTFLQKYAPYATDANFTNVLINGGSAPQNSTGDSGEANLDMQYAASLSYKTPIEYYSTGGLAPFVPDLDEPAEDENEPYLDFLHYILNVPDEKLPQTLTTSYGEDEQSLPKAYARTVCDMFGQLGARGVSIIFSSGDTGVGSACQTNDGRNITRFSPVFPASCPYVTSVGGTRYVEPEQAAYFSAGGFSDLFGRPSYQEAAVSSYLKGLGSKWKGLYNAHGRGFPDVAAQAWGFHIINKDSNFTQQDITESGTSAAAPTFAAIISLLNNARLTDGQAPLGFLNPWLYSVGYKGLTDIVVGGSTGCTGTDLFSGLPAGFVPYASWNATKGWDPVTGLGTPLFDKMLKLAVPNAAWNNIRGGH